MARRRFAASPSPKPARRGAVRPARLKPKPLQTASPPVPQLWEPTRWLGPWVSPLQLRNRVKQTAKGTEPGPLPPTVAREEVFPSHCFSWGSSAGPSSRVSFLGRPPRNRGPAASRSRWDRSHRWGECSHLPDCRHLRGRRAWRYRACLDCLPLDTRRVPAALERRHRTDPAGRDHNHAFAH